MSSPPCPELPIHIALSPAANGLALLPRAPGVLVLLDENSAVVSLTTTANLQLSAATKLQAPASSQGGQRHPDYRAITRAIRALPVGSAFEADWAYLQLARGLLPQTY